MQELGQMNLLILEQNHKPKKNCCHKNNRVWLLIEIWPDFLVQALVGGVLRKLFCREKTEIAVFDGEILIRENGGGVCCWGKTVLGGETVLRGRLYWEGEGRLYFYISL